MDDFFYLVLLIIIKKLLFSPSLQKNPKIVNNDYSRISITVQTDASE